MTCKQRKLKYIREKNRLRLGISKFKSFCKVSNDLSSQELEFFLKEAISENERLLFKQFKLVLNTIEVQYGCDGDDFIKNLKTLLIIRSLK